MKYKLAFYLNHGFIDSTMERWKATGDLDREFTADELLQWIAGEDQEPIVVLKIDRHMVYIDHANEF